MLGVTQKLVIGNGKSLRNSFCRRISSIRVITKETPTLKMSVKLYFDLAIILYETFACVSKIFVLPYLCLFVFRLYACVEEGLGAYEFSYHLLRHA